ncbi:MAG: hypothetical protein JWP85_992 [Rhodoglobus sp.]|nr:hypothetical protein [Rhodoglobus sp.]
MASRAFNGLVSGEPSDDLLRARRALTRLGPDIQQAIFSASNSQLANGWTEELYTTWGSGFSAQQRSIVAASPRVVAHPMGLTVETGGDSKLGFLTRPMEFGTLNRETFTDYDRKSRKGGTHRVTRRTRRQLPPRSQTGWIAYPAASRWSVRAFKMFQQIIVKVAHDAIDGGR